MPKTSLTLKRPGTLKTYVRIRQVDSPQVLIEMEARGVTRNYLWLHRKRFGLYGEFKGDPFKKSVRGGTRKRRAT